MAHDHGGSSSSMMMDSDQFCSGSGTVMLSGFQAANEASVSCVLFLFENAGVDTETKYAFAVLGAFMMGFSNEMIRYGRDLLAKGAFPKLASGDTLGSDTVKTVAFAVQMLLAYFLMLLVMLYEYVILIAIILGLSTGHLVTLRLAAKRRAVTGGDKTPPEGVGSSGSPCCNTSTGQC